MLQLLYSDWIVRFFLLYLLLVGGLMLSRRQRHDLPSPFGILALANRNDRWNGPRTWCPNPRTRWSNTYRPRIGPEEQSERGIRKKLDRDELRYG